MKQKLSILIYSLASGGAERIMSLLLFKLQEKYDITLFLMNNTIFYNIPKNLKIVYLENSNSRERGLNKLLKLPLLSLKYKKLNRADISLSFMNRPNYINILAKIIGMKSKVVVSERSMPSLQHKYGIQGFINRFLIKFLYPKADTVLCNSMGNNHDLIDNFNIKDVKTIHNPIDIENINELVKIPIEYRDEKFTFITVGRLDSGKNHKILIEAMQDIDAKLYIIGDGELRNTLEKQIENLNLKDKVILLGIQPNPYQYLVKSDCFLFSSLNEGFPNVLLESLVCGVPIISTDCKSGPREILAPKSDVTFQLKDDFELAEYGILIPINNKISLIKVMNMIIRNEKLRNEYKDKSLSRAYDFKLDVIIEKIIGVIEDE